MSRDFTEYSGDNYYAYLAKQEGVARRKALDEAEATMLKAVIDLNAEYLAERRRWFMWCALAFLAGIVATTGVGLWWFTTIDFWH